jgi:ABC-2 type transport system permease protein
MGAFLFPSGTRRRQSALRQAQGYGEKWHEPRHPPIGDHRAAGLLLAPLFMILLGVMGGAGAEQVVKSAGNATRVAAIVSKTDGIELKRANDRVIKFMSNGRVPTLEIVPMHSDPDKLAAALFASSSVDYVAIMVGPLESPKITYNPAATGQARYLAELAEQALQFRKAGVTDIKPLSQAKMIPTSTAVSSVGGRQATGYIAVFGIFFLTLLLAGQGVGMLAEEKSNKVIEILAAAAPLEVVFLGKLVGMFGVALLFIGFWGSMGAIALSLGLANATSLAPAIGLPIFLILFALYFSMAFMLLGAVFLGVGGQAATMREIQMLSLPVTIFQVAMFSLSSAAASNPGSSLARFAEWFPFSSPFAMAARAANDTSLWPHLIALVWQALWVGLTIFVAARFFRVGVLKSGSWKTVFRRS